MKITNFTEANSYLAQYYEQAKPVYTLDNMLALMALLDNPQEKYRVIHVAGTSGKSSTAYYAAALLTSAGYKTGLTISPHVDEINERVQINMQPTNESDFCAALSEYSDIISASSIKPSWFEAMVSFAYWYFALVGVDYAVVEVGLGGLLDGTNVINRADKVCVITDIGLDHTKILGSTLPEIAAQKAGIIHRGNQVFMHAQSSEIHDVIATIATHNQASLTAVSKQPLINTMLPVFQERNFILAVTAVEYLVSSDQKKTLTHHQKLQARQTLIPGRMEIISYKGKTIILDGAHNAQKLQALEKALHVKYGKNRIAALIAFAEGDDTRLENALQVIDGLASYIIATSFVSSKDYIKHSVDPEVVRKRANSRVVVEKDARLAFSHLLSRPEEIILVTGSFYLLNHIRPLMLKA